MTQRAHLVFPTCSRADWEKMRRAAVDGHHLHDDVEGFNQANRERIELHTSAGHLVELVAISASALIAWCKAQGTPLDSLARHRFTVHTLQLRDSRAGHA